MSNSATRVRKVYTLIMPIDIPNQRVLLGYKKRGFGVGKYNGFGGKVEAGETPLQGAVRELEEEASLKCRLDDLHHRAVLFLETLADDDAPLLEIHTYVATAWEGEPTESEEMRPEWFSPVHTTFVESPSLTTSLPPIPLHMMWEETDGWLPTLLNVYFDPTANRTNDSGWKDGDMNFIRHVTFVSGINPQTGLKDSWHGMHKSRLTWYKDSVSDWSAEQLKDWLVGSVWTD